MQILGDKKRVRYDEGLIDVVNKKFEKEEVLFEDSDKTLTTSYDKDSLIVIEHRSPRFADVAGKGVHINPTRNIADECASSINWTVHWNRKEKMISMPDVYMLAKQLKNRETNFVYAEDKIFEMPSEVIRKELIEDIRDGIITSTRLQHVGDRIFHIRHHVGSGDFTEKRSILIPYFDNKVNKNIRSFPNGKEMLDLMLALFDTDDCLNDIFSNIEYLFRDEERTGVTSAGMYTRHDAEIKAGKIEAACVIYRSVTGGHGIISVSEDLQLAGKTRGVKYVRP